jgi:hypothetical protein
MTIDKMIERLTYMKRSGIVDGATPIYFKSSSCGSRLNVATVMYRVGPGPLEECIEILEDEDDV